jgi:hypothetical protein
MKPKTQLACGLLLCALAATASPAAAVVPVTFGTSWDGPSATLQAFLDTRYGAGAVNVTTDYIGAHPGDLDPWFWVGSSFPAMLIKEVAGNSKRNTVGWYLETGTKPVLTSANSGVVFDGPATAGASTFVTLPSSMTKFGFWMNPNGPYNASNAPEPETFFTNRFYNDIGPDGSGALHPPYDGDVQALIFDVSKWDGPNSWLVCFEDCDSGAMPGLPGSGAQTDNDFNDFVFEITAFGATPVKAVSFGQIKALYQK